MSVFSTRRTPLSSYISDNATLMNVVLLSFFVKQFPHSTNLHLFVSETVPTVAFTAVDINIVSSSNSDL